MHEDPGGGKEEVSNVKKVSEHKQDQLLQATTVSKGKTSEENRDTENKLQQGNANCSNLDEIRMAGDGTPVDKFDIEKIAAAVNVQTQVTDTKQKVDNKMALQSVGKKDTSDEEILHQTKENLKPQLEMKTTLTPEDCETSSQHTKEEDSFERKKTQSRNGSDLQKVDDSDERKSKDMSCMEHRDKNDDKYSKDTLNKKGKEESHAEDENGNARKEKKDPVFLFKQPYA